MECDTDDEDGAGGRISDFRGSSLKMSQHPYIVVE